MTTHDEAMTRLADANPVRGRITPRPADLDERARVFSDVLDRIRSGARTSARGPRSGHPRLLLGIVMMVTALVVILALSSAGHPASRRAPQRSAGVGSTSTPAVTQSHVTTTVAAAGGRITGHHPRPPVRSGHAAGPRRPGVASTAAPGGPRTGAGIGAKALTSPQRRSAPRRLSAPAGQMAGPSGPASESAGTPATVAEAQPVPDSTQTTTTPAASGVTIPVGPITVVIGAPAPTATTTTTPAPTTTTTTSTTSPGQ